MKKLVFILFIVPALLIAQDDNSDASTLDWSTNFEKSLKKAKRERKNVLLYFTGSDWCTPCVQLKRDLFDSDEFKAKADKYILVYIDHPRNKDLLSAAEWEQTNVLMSKYNKRGAFPLLQVLNSRGKEIDEISGYSGTGVITYYMKMIDKHI